MDNASPPSSDVSNQSCHLPASSGHYPVELGSSQIELASLSSSVVRPSMPPEEPSISTAAETPPMPATFFKGWAPGISFTSIEIVFLCLINLAIFAALMSICANTSQRINNGLGIPGVGPKGSWLRPVIDLTDKQYSSLRPWLFPVTGFIALHVVVGHWLAKNRQAIRVKPGCLLDPYIFFQLLLGFTVAVCLHGFRFVFLFATAGVSFALLPLNKYVVILSWNRIKIASLDASFHGNLPKKFSGTISVSLGVSAVWLWNFGCLIYCSFLDSSQLDSFVPFLDMNTLPQRLAWTVSLRFWVLRNISFVVEHRNSLFRGTGTRAAPTLSSLDANGTLAYKDREALSLYGHLDLFSLKNFLAYQLYPPLYLAGPVTTFNAWISHTCFSRQTTHSFFDLLTYCGNVIFHFLALEVFLHFVFANALLIDSKNSHLWSDLSALELICVSYCHLFFIYMKYVCIWRHARFWSMLDGVEVPENMGRFIYHSISSGGFWRNWHCSINRWNIRYVYVPLGGRKRKFILPWIIFTFVALWHLVQCKLVFWAWTCCAAIMIEAVLKMNFTKIRYGNVRSAWWFKHAVALGGILSQIGLYIANSVGFTFGFQGLSLVFQRLFGGTTFDRFTPLIYSVLVYLNGLWCLFTYTYFDGFHRQDALEAKQTEREIYNKWKKLHRK